MKEWTIERYERSRAGEWNSFVGSARNATFLFNRSYMDYHADRFEDCSMMARKGGKLMAVLPANITADGVLHSHQGLTYGGWILNRRHDDCVSVLEFWEAWLQACRGLGITAVDYKPLPHIYATQPSDEDIYALFRSGAVLTECNASAAIRLANNPGLNENRKRLFRKACVANTSFIRCSTDEEYSSFYKILRDCLEQRHGAFPVHSLSELNMLRQGFENNIQLWAAFDEGVMEAGILLYITDRVVHTQYIATSETARQKSLLSSLVMKLVDEANLGRFGGNVEYFDFGTSNEEHGRVLNETLYRQKASFGASCVAYTRYLLNL